MGLEDVKVKLIEKFIPDSLKAKSVINERERWVFSKLHLLIQPFKELPEYRCHPLEQFQTNYLLYGISLEREGRKEMKDILSTFMKEYVELSEDKKKVEQENIRSKLIKSLQAE